MSISISKWGNSAGIRIPSIMLKNAGLSLGDLVNAEITPDRTILIRAAEPPRLKKSHIDIHGMLALITPENLPDVSIFETTPKGAEVW
jgi:antitoxin component of MazEF toxin-antitoxin module